MKKSELIEIYETCGKKYRGRYDDKRLVKLNRFIKEAGDKEVKIMLSTKHHTCIPDNSKNWEMSSIIGQQKHPEFTFWAYVEKEDAKE